MKAMILAAGLGTRLHPVTKSRPKALVEIYGMPLLEIQIRKLIYFGFNEIIINTHHFASKVCDFLESKHYFHTNIKISDESDMLLETGGGLKKASWFFDFKQDFLVINVDVLTNLNLNTLYQHHQQSDALATLVTRNRKTSRYLLFDSDNNFYGRINQKTGENNILKKNVTQGTKLAFSGIHVINQHIFQLMVETGKFSIIDVYLKLANTYKIKSYQHDKSFWVDIGKYEKLQEVNNSNFKSEVLSYTNL